MKARRQKSLVILFVEFLMQCFEAVRGLNNDRCQKGANCRSVCNIPRPRDYKTKPYSTRAFGRVAPCCFVL